MVPFRLGPLVGGLGPRQANLWAKIRPEDLANASEPIQLRGWIAAKEDFSDAALAAQSYPLGPETDYAGVAPLRNLEPNTRYWYALTQVPVKPPVPDGHFTTFPEDGQPFPFAFAIGSCFLPKGNDCGRAFRILGDYASSQQGQIDEPRFMLMIGDQIYADQYPRNGIPKVATTLADYRAVYNHTWADPEMRKLMAVLPAYMALDDHEVDDDWAWWDEAHTRAYNSPLERFLRFIKGCPVEERVIRPERIQVALQACWEHQYMHTNGFVQPFQFDADYNYIVTGSDPGSLAYTFSYGAAAFFVMDTRTCRVRDLHNIHMLGDTQKQMLKDWLLQVDQTHQVKFLVTSSAFLFELWVDIARDRWTGYKTERNDLLKFIAENNIRNIYFIAGDLHSGHALSVDLQGADGNPIRVWEFCASPFMQKVGPFTWSYKKIRSPDIIRGSQHKHFCRPKINFGIVNVKYEAGCPHVQYDLHYEKEKGVWRSDSAGE
jgi:alkaline phosphatase D